MQREGFIFYSSFLRAIDCLPKENQLKAYQFIVKYGLNGIDPPQDEDPIAYAIFMMAKPQLDANNKRFVNGAKGGAPQGNSNAKKDWENILKQPKTTEKQPKDNQKQPKEKDKVKDNVKEKQKKEKAEDAFASLTVGTSFEELNPEVQKAYLDFLENRKAMGIKNTSQATKQHLNLLKKIGNPKLQIATITKAIGAGWRGLFELTEKEKQMILNSDPPSKKPSQNLDFSGFTRDLKGRT